MKIEIRRWDNNEITVSGGYESVKDCLEKNNDKCFSRANLSRANLSGDDLKNYSESHDIFMHLIRENLIKFTIKEQEIAGRVFALRLCWNSIKKEYGKKIMPIFKKLSRLGFNEYEEKYKSVLKAGA